MKSKLNGMAILLKWLLLNQVNQFKLFILNMQPMLMELEKLIMVFNSISTLDLNTPLMELDKILRCTLSILLLIKIVDLLPAMGIMFSVDNPTPGVSASDVAIIDEFFDSL